MPHGQTERFARSEGLLGEEYTARRFQTVEVGMLETEKSCERKRSATPQRSAELSVFAGGEGVGAGVSEDVEGDNIGWRWEL